MNHESEVKSKHAVHVSSERQDHATPWPFFNRLNDEFGFTFDVCAQPHNAKCEHYLTPEMDGLKQDWVGVCWCNPPYGRHIGKWVYRAAWQSSWNSSTIVCLLPARTDTQWFHEHVMGVAHEVRLVKGRIVFEGLTAGAPFPAMVAIYRFRDLFDERGIDTRFTTMPNK